MTTSPHHHQAEKPEKVVVKLENQLVRGYLESYAYNTVEALLRNAPYRYPSVIRIRHLESGACEEISTANAKAIFYVKSFEGEPHRKDLKFHSRTQIVDGIWIRVQFLDGEIMEGIVSNNFQLLIAPGFFLRPTDPESNNTLVYVFKTQLKDCRVLGLRNL